MKREAGTLPGRVSNWLHDHLEVGDVISASAPFGDFQPVADPDAPVVLLSAGAGITPMISVLNTLAETDPRQEIIFAHAARSRFHHAHLADIQAAKKRMPALQVVSFYENMHGVPANEENVHQGYMEMAALPGWSRDRGNVYLCGPQEFMQGLWNQLRQAGVAHERIHREVFGPALLENLQ